LQVTISHNQVGSPECSETLPVDLRWSIGEIKVKLAEKLGVSTEGIHLRRSAKGAQLREEDKTLKELKLIDGSPLFVMEGKVRGAEEILVKFYLYRPGEKPAFAALFQTSLARQLSIHEVKQSLCDKLALLAEPKKKLLGGWTGGPGQLRLRDKKEKEAGKIFPDAKKLSTLAKMDGKELAVQLLDHDETVGGEDIIIQVRQWRIDCNEIDRPMEMIISKNASLGELETLLAKAFDLEGNFVVPPTADGEDAAAVERSRLSMAKASNFGPPLKPTGASKLKWSPAGADSERLISSSPWGLRDGSLVVVRDEEVYCASSGALLGGKVAHGDFDVEVQVPRIANKVVRREQGIKIHVAGVDDGDPRCGPA